jgi:Arc/MetJ family transcription regulator
VRTTVDLPSGLLEEAMELAGTETKKETIVTAVREYVRWLQREALISELGHYKLDMTQEDLERLRADD